MRTTLILISCLPFLAGLALAAPSPTPGSPIGDLTPEEFAKAGLSKLTPDELSFLEAALVRHQSAATQAILAKPAEIIVKSKDKAAASFGAEQVKEVKRMVTEQELHAHIEGSVQDISGRAVFVLDNGQVWQLRMPESIYFSSKLVNPEVIITRGMFGYRMLFVAKSRVVFVKRIQ
jgi:hypothetical protein